MLTPCSGRAKRASKSGPIALGGLRFAQFGPPGDVPAPANVPDAREHSPAAPVNPPQTGDAGADPRGQMDAEQAA